MVRTKTTIEDSFSDPSPVKPPRNLFRRIIRRLGLEKRLKITKKHLVWSSLVLVASCAALFFAVNFLKHELAESEFSPIISLLFSDTLATLSHGGDFALAFLESIPVIYITALLAAVMLLMIGLKLVLQYISRLTLLIKSMHKKYGHN